MKKMDKIYKEIIIKDLQAAGIKVSIKYAGTDIGKATRGAAKLMPGKVIGKFKKALHSLINNPYE